MGEEDDIDKSCPHFCPYAPEKWKTMIFYINVNSSSHSEKSITKLTTCNSDDKIFKPINLFSSDLRKIDLELKNMHRIWSNID
jgi:hypothetical protein